MTLIVKERSGERGNVLFLILIAVALFAALSYAVTQSTRSGSGDASGETNLINSAQLAQYPAGVRTAVVRMVINGISVDQLVFDAPADFDNVSDLTYDVFHPTGGGAVYQLAPKDVLNAASPGSSGGLWIFSSKYQIDGVGSTTDGGGGNVGNDIISFLPGVAMNVCKKLNDEVGIISTEAPATDGIPLSTLPTYPTLADTMSETQTAGIPSGEPTGIIAGDLVGQPFGCFRVGAVGATTATYVYYHVLVER